MNHTPKTKNILLTILSLTRSVSNTVAIQTESTTSQTHYSKDSNSTHVHSILPQLLDACTQRGVHAHTFLSSAILHSLYTLSRYYALDNPAESDQYVALSLFECVLHVHCRAIHEHLPRTLSLHTLDVVRIKKKVWLRLHTQLNSIGHHGCTRNVNFLSPENATLQSHSNWCK